MNRIFTAPSAWLSWSFRPRLAPPGRDWRGGTPPAPRPSPHATPRARRSSSSKNQGRTGAIGSCGAARPSIQRPIAVDPASGSDAVVRPCARLAMASTASANTGRRRHVEPMRAHERAEERVVADRDRRMAASSSRQLGAVLGERAAGPQQSAAHRGQVAEVQRAFLVVAELVRQDRQDRAGRRCRPPGTRWCSGRPRRGCRPANRSSRRAPARSPGCRPTPTRRRTPDRSTPSHSRIRCGCGRTRMPQDRSAGSALARMAAIHRWTNPASERAAGKERRAHVEQERLVVGQADGGTELVARAAGVPAEPLVEALGAGHHHARRRQSRAAGRPRRAGPRSTRARDRARRESAPCWSGGPSSTPPRAVGSRAARAARR